MGSRGWVLLKICLSLACHHFEKTKSDQTRSKKFCVRAYSAYAHHNSRFTFDASLFYQRFRFTRAHLQNLLKVGVAYLCANFSKFCRLSFTFLTRFVDVHCKELSQH